MNEYIATPPGLDEVVRELDTDTKHIGRPTRSPRRPPWKADPYHFSSDTRKWLTEGERVALVKACVGVDPQQLGRIPIAAIGEVLAAVGSESLRGKVERACRRERASSERGSGEETLTFQSLVSSLSESNRLVRSPFGGKRCIVSRIPLPPCCKNGYCVAHMEKPSAAAVAGNPGGDLQTAALKLVFAKHDTDGSGALEMEELPKILEEHGVEYDERRLPEMFSIYDVDRSGALDFEEFSALLKDMDADKAVANKRMLTYHLPASLLKEFSADEIGEMRMTFGMMDESGDGVLDEEELEKLLIMFGQKPTKEKIHAEMLKIDYDRSGTVEFQEFVMLMKKIRDGEVELDDSAFGRAILNSTTATRLNHELKVLAENLIGGVESAKLVKSSPATLRAIVAGPDGTPYEGYTMTIEVVALEGYPSIAPVARILERVFHLNFTVLLDGTTAMRPLLDQWTAAWNVSMILREVLRLLREPDPSLLPLELRGNESSSSGRRVVVSRPSRIMEIRLPPALLGKGDGFNDDVDDDTWDQPYQPRLNHEAHRERPQRLEDEEHEGTQDQLQEQTTRRVNASKSDSNPYHVKEDNDVGTNTTFSMTVRSEESHSSRRDASCSYVNCNTFGVGGTGNHRNEDDDSASVAWTAEGNNHNGSNDSNRGFPNERRKGGVPGDDLREIKRSAVLSAHIASLWFSDRALYNLTAKSIAEQGRKHETA